MKRWRRQRTVVRRSVWNLLKNGTTRLAGMAMCISRDIPKRCLQKISEPESPSRQLAQNWKEWSMQLFRALLILMTSSAWFYWIRSLFCPLVPTNGHLLPKESADRVGWVYTESEKWSSSFEKRSMKQRVSNAVCNNGALKALPGRLPPGTCISGKRRALHQLSELLSTND